MAIKGLEWVTWDKMAHFVGGLMIFSLSMGFAKLSPEISMLIVTVLGFAKEYFDKYRHKLKIKKGFFDKYDVIATIMGGAVGVTLFGIYRLIEMIF